MIKEYYIYYLPAENYVGVSGDLERRIHYHKHTGKIVSGWKILATCLDKKTAYKIERLLQIDMKANGLHIPKGKPGKPVDQFSEDGTFIARHDSCRSADRALGLSYGSVSNVVRGLYKTTGGFIFKFSEK